MPQPHLEQDKLIVGRIGTVYGVKGWLKIHSFTEPRENILNYLPWLMQRQGIWTSFELADSSVQTGNIVAQFKGCQDRESAQLYVGAEIAIYRAQLPKLAENEYYWTDLEGVTVINTEGVVLGKIDYLFTTGANDVMVIKGEKQHLIPFLFEQFIVKIDLQDRTMQVDWDPDF